MLGLEHYIARPDFNGLRAEVLACGVEQPFFDEEAVWGNYCLEQNSFEFTAFLLFLKDRFPGGMNNYAEIGSAAGGFIRAISEFVGFKSAISIDDGKWRHDMWSTNLNKINSPVLRYDGDSHSETCRRWLELHLTDHVDLFFIDGDHSYEGIKKDIALVTSLVKPGTLIGFHDIVCDRVPGVGKAYREVVAQSPHFKIEAEFINRSYKNRMGISICTWRG